MNSAYNSAPFISSNKTAGILRVHTHNCISYVFKTFLHKWLMRKIGGYLLAWGSRKMINIQLKRVRRWRRQEVKFRGPTMDSWAREHSRSYFCWTFTADCLWRPSKFPVPVVETSTFHVPIVLFFFLWVLSLKWRQFEGPYVTEHL